MPRHRIAIDHPHSLHLHSAHPNHHGQLATLSSSASSPLSSPSSSLLLPSISSPSAAAASSSNSNSLSIRVANSSRKNNKIVIMDNGNAEAEEEEEEKEEDNDSGYAMDVSIATGIYAWMPPNTKMPLIQRFFGSLPVAKVPRFGTRGEKWRIEQLKWQMPKQDNPPLMGENGPEELRELREMAKRRDKWNRGRGIIWERRRRIDEGDGRKIYCHQCKCPIDAENVAIGAERHFGQRALWHPGCFACVECKELLVDLIYFHHQENVFCGRHYAELFKPRCAGCDKLIFSEECTEAEGRFWHSQHFCCIHCGIQLGGQQYLMIFTTEPGQKPRQQQQPCCLLCFRRNHCQHCAKPIHHDWPHIAQANFRWHANVECFCCSTCHRPLLGKSFSLHFDGRLFCEGGCANGFASQILQQQSSFSSLNGSSLGHPINSSSSLPSSNCSPLPSPFSSPQNSQRKQQKIPQESVAARAVRFNLRQQSNGPLLLPPSLPTNAPPPAPSLIGQRTPINKLNSKFTTSSVSSREAREEENAYETVIIQSTNNNTSTECGGTSSSSGCSANGSFTSSISTGSRRIVPLNTHNFSPKKAQMAFDPSMKDNYRRQRSKQLAGEGRGMERRRCRSADSRRKHQNKERQTSIKMRGFPRNQQHPNHSLLALDQLQLQKQKYTNNRSMECYHLSDSSSSNSGIDECCSSSNSSCSEEDIEHPGASLLRHYLAIVDAESTRNCIKWRNGQKSKNNEPRIKTILAPSNNAKYAKKRNSEAGHSDKTQSSCRIS